MDLCSEACELFEEHRRRCGLRCAGVPQYLAEEGHEGSADGSDLAARRKLCAEVGLLRAPLRVFSSERGVEETEARGFPVEGY